MRAISYKRRRSLVITIIGLVIAILIVWKDSSSEQPSSTDSASDQPKVNVQVDSSIQPLASDSLSKLAIKGRSAKTGYSRDKFGNGWAIWKSCDTRQKILERDLTDIKFDYDGCTVLSGILNDPYTGEIINFTRGPETSSIVQIDHVVALSDAWQKGAQALSAEKREALANDDLELIAVNGQANQQKLDGDAATWLPSNKAFRCQYIARQIAIKIKYSLWITPAEHDAMARILDTCPEQRLPAP